MLNLIWSRCRVLTISATRLAVALGMAIITSSSSKSILSFSKVSGAPTTGTFCTRFPHFMRSSSKNATACTPRSRRMANSCASAVPTRPAPMIPARRARWRGRLGVRAVARVRAWRNARRMAVSPRMEKLKSTKTTLRGGA